MLSAHDQAKTEFDGPAYIPICQASCRLGPRKYDCDRSYQNFRQSDLRFTLRYYPETPPKSIRRSDRYPEE